MPYLFYPDASRLTAEARAQLAAFAEPHRARRRLPDRDARSRDPRCRRPARRRAVRPRRGARLRALRRDAQRGRGRALRSRPSGGPPGRRCEGRRLHPRLVRRVRGTQDRHAPRAIALVEHDDELRELRAGVEDRYGPLPEPVENLFSIQEAKLKLALIGADYLVYRGGRVTVGPLALGSSELRSLRAVADTLVYTQAKREVSLRTDDQGGVGACRCYSRGAFGRLRAAIPAASRRIPTDRNCELTRPRLYIHRLISATPTRASFQ